MLFKFFGSFLVGFDIFGFGCLKNIRFHLCKHVKGGSLGGGKCFDIRVASWKQRPLGFEEKHRISRKSTDADDVFVLTQPDFIKMFKSVNNNTLFI